MVILINLLFKYIFALADLELVYKECEAGDQCYLNLLRDEFFKNLNACGYL